MSIIKIIEPNVLVKMVEYGAKYLDINKEIVNDLNVFPVPDGDTGTNMSLTMQGMCRAVEDVADTTYENIAKAITSGALKSARGNSGVILSQIFKGFALEVEQCKEFDKRVLARALESASAVAYKAISKPQEGTILTVIREMAEFAKANVKKFEGVDDFLNAIIERGEQSVKDTPKLLKVLEDAGVVDSGGKGLVTILIGFYKALVGDESLELVDTDSGSAEETESEVLAFESEDEIAFMYCTEFFIVNLKKRTTTTDIEKLKNYLDTLGDSVLCVGDLSSVKVHIHTNEPHRALAQALKLGEVHDIKIDNMKEQVRQLLKKRESKRKPHGILAISAGDGFKAIFKDINVDVLAGGQTMNPSAEDILKAVRRVNAEVVFVLPNNSNIILAANQAKELAYERAAAQSKAKGKNGGGSGAKPIEIVVIPTKSIPQGISASLGYDPTLSVEENEELMKEAFAMVKVGQVTRAVRTTSVGDIKIKEGDIIGLDLKDILCKAKKVPDAVVALVEKLYVSDEHYVLTLYYGADITERDANRLATRLQDKYQGLEVSVLNGAQPVYYYLIALE
ncbi:MAG: DAK2 domain-containing protein [Firmicutes bacterium]|nr:DAK2 domain-containing protein [Bacillota bacterium]